MERFITISILALIFLTVGCDNHERQVAVLLNEGQRLEARRAGVLASARESVAFAREFDQLFSCGRTSAGESRFGWNYDFEIGLYGRYVIQGRVPLNVDTNTMNVLTSGPPIIYVAEVGRVLALSDGRYSATFTTNHAQLGAAEWKKIVDSHGDFSVVGYAMFTNMPIANFHQICGFLGSLSK